MELLYRSQQKDASKVFACERRRLDVSMRNGYVSRWLWVKLFILRRVERANQFLEPNSEFAQVALGRKGRKTEAHIADQLELPYRDNRGFLGRQAHARLRSHYSRTESWIGPGEGWDQRVAGKHV